MALDRLEGLTIHSSHVATSPSFTNIYKNKYAVFRKVVLSHHAPTSHQQAAVTVSVPFRDGRFVQCPMIVIQYQPSSVAPCVAYYCEGEQIRILADTTETTFYLHLLQVCSVVCSVYFVVGLVELCLTEDFLTKIQAEYNTVHGPEPNDQRDDFFREHW